MKFKIIILPLISFILGSQVFADAGSTISVMQFNLHNVVFTNGWAWKETALMNKGDPQKGIGQYDFMMTEENSTPDQQPRNLLDFGLDHAKYGLCGGIHDASLFYNITRWNCDHAVTFDVTPNAHPDGSRKVTVGVLLPKLPNTPVVLAATSHWCVPWGTSNCKGENVPAAHAQDAITFSNQLKTLMSAYPNALVIFGGDLNSMSQGESNTLVAQMKALGYETANPYDAAHQQLLPTMGGTPDLIFYKQTSLDQSSTLTLTTSFINDMQHLSDHWGAVIAKFSY